VAADDYEIRLPMLGFLDDYYFGIPVDDGGLNLQRVLYRIVPEPVSNPHNEIMQAALFSLQQLETHRTNDMERIGRIRLWHGRCGKHLHLGVHRPRSGRNFLYSRFAARRAVNGQENFHECSFSFFGKGKIDTNSRTFTVAQLIGCARVRESALHENISHTYEQAMISQENAFADVIKESAGFLIDEKSMAPTRATVRSVAFPSCVCKNVRHPLYAEDACSGWI
jgi:hypothetical protein